MQHKNFRDDIAYLIEYYGQDKASGMPTHIMADYAVECLRLFGKSLERLEKWADAQDNAQNN